MNSKGINVSLSQARAFSLCHQLLVNPRLKSGKAGVFEALERLGYVQIDTINVVERSHHLVFFARCSDYRQQYLHELQANDMKIFEYWAHAASYIPIHDYRFYISTMRKKPKKDSWLDRWTRQHRILLKEVKNRIVREGPLSANDFEDVANRKRGTWWDWKPAKMALEVLFWRGELMIKERRNFQRVYDCTERVLTDDVNTNLPDAAEEDTFFIKRSLGALGIATVQDINKYIGVRGMMNDRLQELVTSGEVVPVHIDGLQRQYYVLADDANCLQDAPTFDPAVRFLSPFDNSIILRERTRTLFDFAYSLECYLPLSKRTYGYFCLPILWRNQLVGRIDPKADRKTRALIIHSIHLETKRVNLDEFIPPLVRALVKFMRFHHCEKIVLGKNVPSRIRKAL